MAGRLALLPSGAQGCLELLPPTASLASVLDDERGQRFQAALGGGVQLHWRHHAALAWQPNPLASRLAGTPVCCDAVLELPAGCASDAQARALLDGLCSKHLRGLDWRVSDACRCGAPADVRGEARCLRLHRQALHARLLGQRRSVDDCSGSDGPAPGSVPGLTAASPVRASPPPAAEAPATPPARRAAGSSAAPEACVRLRVQAQPRRREQGQDGEDPRQQLLWQIAARATSIAWDAPTSSPAAAPAPSATAVATAAAALPTQAAATASASLLPAATASASLLPAAVVPAAAAPAAAECGQPAKHRSSLDAWGAPWADLQPELLAAVLEQAGHSSTLARTLSQVCASWRQGVGQERAALQRLRFARLERLAAASSAGSLTLLPWLVRQAVAAGNVAATVAAARCVEAYEALQRIGAPGTAASALASGTWYGGGGGGTAYGVSGGVSGGTAAAASAAGGMTEAGRLWRAAAKLGHPEAQGRLGCGFYRGELGFSHDGEEAYIWLTRAAKQLAEILGWPLDGASASGGAAAPCRPLPALLTPAGCRHLLAQSAHILGYLCLDGEGTKADVGAALRWFRLAQRAGCAEAGRMIGSLLNTGQYG